MKKYINNRLKHFTAVESGNGKYSIYKGQFFDSTLDAELITGSSEWILQKDFEITAFRGLVSAKYIYTLTDSGEFVSKIDNLKYSYDGMIESVWDKRREIYSVRNSAGVEFKLGDKTNKGFIEKFKIDDSSMICVCEGNFNAWDISNITLSPAVLLTTFDGVEITNPEQTVYYMLNYEIHYPTKAKYFSKSNVGKYFSTREAAEDYISKNKKKYSENDILTAWGRIGRSSCDLEDLINRLNSLK